MDAQLWMGYDNDDRKALNVIQTHTKTLLTDSLSRSSQLVTFLGPWGK